MRIVKITSVVAIATLGLSAASAQISVPINTMAFDTSMSVAMNPCSAGRCARGRRPGVAVPRGVAPRAITGAALPASAPVSVGIYQPTDAMAKQALAGYVERIRRSSPQTADQVAREFGKHDYRRIYSNIAGAAGFRSDSVSDAMAAYMTLAWIVANGQTEAPPRAIATGLRRQFAARVAGDANVLGNRAKFGEELKLLLVTMHAGFQSAAREGRQRQYSDGVAAMIRKQFNLDLRSLKMTPDGFVNG